ncbi:MAG: hypothetical protein M2R45_04979 [Verrucomicrobia subdivision 3 bacterium]|nr:hypothetical protein [Limisphaerales bacterium]MCS1414074.1 hypothetical protein [Limisphaerales bacterium]
MRQGASNTQFLVDENYTLFAPYIAAAEPYH